MPREYQICKKCIMDTSDPAITFDENGVCYYCNFYKKLRTEYIPFLYSKENLEKQIEKAKKDGKGKKYDCIIGVSGGVDSSIVAYFVKKFGLRPLAVHLDNGWNSQESVANIERVLKKLDIDLYTYVIDWEEFKNLQLSFFKASVSNLEIPTDHAIGALICKKAREMGIKYFVHGGNINSEFILPRAWGYDTTDLKHLKAVHKRFGSVKLKTFPMLSVWKLIYYKLFKKIQPIPILNYMNYNKEDAKEFLKKEFGWQDYGGKHGESVFTRFFQSYILPVKFNIDKRKAHYSSLINSGQMTREEALEKIKKDPITDKQTQQDKEYVIRKLGLSPQEFEDIMALPVKSYKDYPNQSLLIEKLPLIYISIKNFLRRRIK